VSSWTARALGAPSSSATWFSVLCRATQYPVRELANAAMHVGRPILARSGTESSWNTFSSTSAPTVPYRRLRERGYAVLRRGRGERVTPELAGRGGRGQVTVPEGGK
jgi:hypothetical protein